MQQMWRILVVFMAIGLDITSAGTTTVKVTTTASPVTPPVTTTASPVTTVTTPVTTTASSTAVPVTTTAAPGTTPVPTPEIPDAPKLGNFSNNCLAVKGAFQFSVQYTTSGGKMQTAVINLPQNAVTRSSNCSDLIHFPLNFQVKDGDFNFTMIFNRTATDIVMSGVEFQYNQTADNFPGTTTPDVKDAFNYTMNLNQFNNDKYWLCNANTTVQVSDKVKYTVKTLDVSAVGSKRTSAQQCPDDAVVSYTVPIAVGAALAGLVLIILIAYVIGRTRNKKGYESV